VGKTNIGPQILLALMNKVHWWTLWTWLCWS